ncbi:Hypothetical_protein [Hexamita inflata]|uniref:Hypothetical_protein n=1 Tax=Hexamita inflata TaxID=28002 RepID=A0AA86UZW0_9EUKA|nr:Hypothetical protein HINF_LOCUS58531 [Hexamita inflata]
MQGLYSSDHRVCIRGYVVYNSMKRTQICQLMQSANFGSRGLLLYQMQNVVQLQQQNFGYPRSYTRSNNSLDNIVTLQIYTVNIIQVAVKIFRQLIAQKNPTNIADPLVE